MSNMTDDSSHFNVTNSMWNESLQCHELNGHTTDNSAFGLHM